LQPHLVISNLAENFLSDLHKSVMLTTDPLVLTKQHAAPGRSSWNQKHQKLNGWCGLELL